MQGLGDQVVASGASDKGVVVLDLYDTLVRSAAVVAELRAAGAEIPDAAAAWVDAGMPAAPALLEMGVDPRSVQRLHLTGRFPSVASFIDAVRRVHPDTPLPSASVVAVAERATELALERATLLEDVAIWLEALRPRLRLVSDCSWPAAQVIDRLELRRWFADPILSCVEGRLKQDGRAFRLAAARAGFPASTGVVVGDGWLSDIRGALRAGMAAVLIDRSGCHPCRQLLDDLRPVFVMRGGAVRVRAEVRESLSEVLPVAPAAIEADPTRHLAVAADGRVRLRALARVSTGDSLAAALARLAHA